MIKVKRIDHVAIAVPDLAGSSARLRDLFGLEAGAHEMVAGQGTEVQFLHAGTADTALEMIAPSGNDALRRFVDKRGTALHHVCLEVDDLAGALKELKAAGVPLVDEVPRPGARGHLVGFLHPRATGGVLFELCQAGEGHRP